MAICMQCGNIIGGATIKEQLEGAAKHICISTPIKNKEWKPTITEITPS